MAIAKKEDKDEQQQTTENTALKSDHDGAGDDVDSMAKKPSLSDSAANYVNEHGRSNSDVVLVVKQADEEFVGLKKEELLKFASDPYWVRVRIVLLVLFAIIWVAMLAAAIIIIVVAPKCPPRPEQDWWETALVYQINPDSFLDTNGDGKGDLNGIHKQLDYLRNSLHVSAVNIGPIYPSTHMNFGYDVSNHKMVCPQYGTMNDFENLRVALHKKGIKLILDFIPNHTSRRHKWFAASRNRSIDDGGVFKDYYVWESGTEDTDGTRHPPNGWLNVYNESAWTFDDARKQYYYHTYSAYEPDLNLGNPRVVKELDDVLLFWLGKYVDGFRFVGVDHLFEPSNLNEDDDEEVQPQTYQLIAHWREVLDNYTNNSDLPKSRRFPRLLLVDVEGTANETLKYVSYDDGHLGSQLPTNKALLSMDGSCDARCVFSLVTKWSTSVASDGKYSNWQIGNEETSRIVSRMGSRRYVNAVNMLLLTLPGTAFVYYGDELGMKDTKIDNSSNVTSIKSEQFPRALQRSPMQWSDKANAGFSSAAPWIPVADDYHETNVEAELAHGSGMGHVKVFETLAKLRDEPSFQWGRLHPAVDKNVFFFVRQAEGFPGFLVAVNFGPVPSTVNFKDSTAVNDLLPDEAEVAGSTHNFEGAGRSDNFNVGVRFELSRNVYLKPTEGIVLKWMPEASVF